MAKTTYTQLSIVVSPAAAGLVAAPSWMSSLVAGRWSTFTTTNTFQSAFRTGVLAFIGNELDITRAYNGSVLVPPGDLAAYPKGLQMFWGGGHAVNIPIPEVLAIDLSGPTWVAMNTDPYDTTASASATYPTGLLASGEPTTPHTYDRLAYDPTHTSMFVYSLPTIQDSGSESDRVRRCAWFNADTGKWDAVSPIFSAGGVGTASSSVYDSTNDCFWITRVDGSGSGTMGYGKVTNTANGDGTRGAYTQYGTWSLSTDHVGAFDPVRDLVVMANFRPTTQTVEYKSVTNPSAARVSLPVTSMSTTMSALPTDLRGQGAWEWSETLQGFVWTSGFTSPNVYLFKCVGSDPSVASSWVISSLLDAGNSVSPTSSSSSLGSFSKLQLVRYSDMEVLVGVTSEPTYRYIFRIA